MATIAYRADCIYGATGVRKTSNIGLAAIHFHKKTNGGVTRLISMDPGGFEPIQSLVDEGIVVPWVPNLRDNVIEAFDLACQGYWPLDPEDPKSPLQPPSKTDWSKIAAYGIEGLTSGGDMMMARLEAKNASLSQDPSYKWTDGTTTYSGGNMTYYGFVQSRIQDFVKKSHMLPVLERVIWTALEGKGEEEGTKAPIYGPAIAGKKAVGKAGQWFGNLLHIDLLTSEETIEVEVEKGKPKVKQIVLKSRPVMFIRNHAETGSKIPYPAKTRAPFQLAATLPDFVEPDLGTFYKMMDDLRGKARASLLANPLSATVVK